MAFEILDCTLRDGGYYTSWDFDDALVQTYLYEVAKLPINTLEVGYCNHPAAGYRGEWCYLGKERLAWAREILRPDQELGIMLDAKDCTPERLPELLGHLVGTVDIVRMAVAPKEFAHGVSLARALKQLGFKVGFNTMYLSTYSEDLREFRPLLEGYDVIDVLAVVDSYGGCVPTQVARQITAVREMFPGKPIGFHGHDNTCLAFANSLAALEAGAFGLDATFVGMGRGAGNTRTEMLLVEKARSGVEVDFDAVASIVQQFETLRDTFKWGSNLAYMLSGAANLPQKDVMDWLGKSRYSPVSVVRALKNQSNALLDDQAFPALSTGGLPGEGGDTVLIIGGGGSVTRHIDAIRRFARAGGVCVVHANTQHLDLVGTFGGRELVCLPGHAAVHLPDSADGGAVAGFVVPKPPRFHGTVPTSLKSPVFQAAPYPPSEGGGLGPVSDIGPLALAFGAARAVSARKIFLVGFDGYAHASVAQQELATEIQATINRMRAEPDVSVASLTPTLYDVATRSIYAEAQALEV
ncbi:hypothetical protein [Methylorubrum salsuginis]|uniref:4-hydroxy 2-oxovalerate aldolase n=1 Tax=Methylorubrum salsuginis TaxID=414703 RepID=A0A1I4HAQ2_9HYPH|nr:hypothetical protein [Methylorubrum salsuginis]SFL38687.1 4-hydroxy 2-oxovalerate aldolase [Methylorubrum salsuginis]